MRKNLIIVLISTVSLIGFSGCSSKEAKPEIINAQEVIIKKEKPYSFNYVPIIGTQTPDDKVIVDMGVALRIWINSYKDRGGNLISSHDNYIWARKPDFIAGNDLPSRQRGLLTPRNQMPFMLSNENIDRSNFEDNKNIREFVNSIYESKTSKKAIKERKVKASKFDDEIKSFISELKKDKNKLSKED